MMIMGFLLAQTSHACIVSSPRSIIPLLGSRLCNLCGGGVRHRPQRAILFPEGTRPQCRFAAESECIDAVAMSHKGPYQYSQFSTIALRVPYLHEADHTFFA